METYKDRIERKYNRIARLPEGLMGFTVPIRKKAIAHLNLSRGASVIDVGCGTGASFPYLEDIIGGSGRILGIEPSRSMINAARERVEKAGWTNITLQEITVEDAAGETLYDGALLFAMHDVFNSLQGIKKIHTLLKEGAKIACAGPMIQSSGFLRVVNPMLNLLFKRMAISQENKDKPWRLVESVFTTDRLIIEKHGLIFIFVGHK